MTKCIVIGGSGFIGSHLLKKLIDTNIYEEILVLDISPLKIKHPIIDFREIDIRFPITLDLTDGYDVCFHLAALCKEPGYDWDEYFETNYSGTENVCSWLKEQNIKQLVFTSTMMVYRASDKRNKEDDLTSPDTAYGISKLLSERVVQQWGKEQSSRKVTSIRLGVVYGEGEKGNYTRLYQSLAKRKFAYIGRKSTFKGSIYVKDVVSFLCLITDRQKKQNDTFNLIYNEPTTISYICEIMQSVQGGKRYIPIVPYKLALFISYGCEFLNAVGMKNNIHHRRIQKLYKSTNIDPSRAYGIGFNPQFSLKTSIEDWLKGCGGSDIY